MPTIKDNIKNRILKAAHALVAEGIESPTNDQVRERLGGGSLSHISPVMSEWRASRKEEVIAALELPAELKQGIETALSQVWRAASKLASVEIDRIREEAEEMTSTAIAERDEAFREITRLEQEVAQLQKTIERKEKKLQESVSNLEKEQSQQAQMKVDTAVLKTQLEDRDRHIATLTTELTEARGENKKMQGELVEIAKQSKR